MTLIETWAAVSAPGGSIKATWTPTICCGTARTWDLGTKTLVRALILSLHIYTYVAYVYICTYIYVYMISTLNMALYYP